MHSALGIKHLLLSLHCDLWTVNINCAQWIGKSRLNSKIYSTNFLELILYNPAQCSSVWIRRVHGSRVGFANTNRQNCAEQGSNKAVSKVTGARRRCKSCLNLNLKPVVDCGLELFCNFFVKILIWWQLWWLIYISSIFASKVAWVSGRLMQSDNGDMAAQQIAIKRTCYFES